MPKHVFKKFERSQTPPRFRIGAVDMRILKDLTSYRFLDTKQILTLHPDYTARTVRSRLQLLYHAGYVERPRGQFSYYEHPHIYRHVPGWELNIQQLQEVPPRCCYIANKPENGIVGICTLPVPSPWEFMSYADNQWDEETFNSLTREIGIGAAYVRNREEIERECTERAKGLLAEETDDDFKHIKSNAEA